MPVLIGLLYLLTGSPSKIHPFLGRFVHAKTFSGNHNKVKKMTYSIRTTLAIAVTGATLLLVSTASQALDVETAKTLARQNNCFKCHAIDKDKEGPAYKKVAEKYK